MSTTSKTRNPLIHNGTSQYERLLQALTPEYFKIDDRSLKDLLEATYQYAQLLHYYNEKNEIQGDWICFWKVEMLTFLAHLSTLDAEQVLEGYEQIKEQYQEILENASGAELTNKLNLFHLALIEYLRQQAATLEGFLENPLENLPLDLPLRQEVIALIEKDSITDTEQLAGSLQTLIGFHKEAYQRVNRQRLPIDTYLIFKKNYWGIPDENAFYQIDSSDDYRFNNQEELEKILKAFYQTFKKIRLRANYWFDKNLATPQLRQPHIALFLTFLRLFDHARNSLNNLTRKHLEFYYEKVLCLRHRPAMPDDAHLILELAATVDNHLIEKGTAFLAGRDKNGKPLIFQTLEDWFLNKTQVKSLKTTYLDVHGILKDENGNRTKRILASDDVFIAYQNAEPLPNETNTRWRSMGDNEDLPDGEIGFAIASPQLILREGKRIIDFSIQLDRDLKTLNNVCDPPENTDNCVYSNYIAIQLSSVEEWIEVQYINQPEKKINFSEVDFGLGLIKPSFNSRFRQENNDNFLDIRIVLEKDHLSVDTLGDELNQVSGFNSLWPVAKIAIKPDKKKLPADLYQQFRCVKFKTIKIKVDVKEIQENLIIQSDLGVFDGTQKFYPFGPMPETQSRFFIGSTEVFQKALQDLQIEFDWINPPAFDAYYHDYTVIDNTISLVYPALRIDFIDRANERETKIPQRFNQTGEVTPPTDPTASISSLKGIVTNVTNVGLEGVKITVINVINNVSESKVFSTKADGTYLIKSSDVTLNKDTQLIFSLDNYETTPSEGEAPITIGKFGMINGTLTHIANYQIINVALYPKRVNPVENSNFNGNLKFTVFDAKSPNTKITNTALESTIDNITETYDNTTNLRTFNDLSINSPYDLNLIYKEGQNSEKGRIKVNFQQPHFPELDIRSLPLEISTSNNGVQDKIQLSIQDDTINNADLKKIVTGIRVSPLDDNDQVINNGVSVNLPTKFDDFFEITGANISDVKKIIIKYDQDYELIIPAAQNNSYTIKHFVKRFSKTIKLSGVINDFSGTGITAKGLKDVKIKVVGTNLQITTDENGNYLLEGVPLDILPIKIELTFRTYKKEVSIPTIAGNSILNVDLLPIQQQISTPSDPPAGSSLGDNNVRIVIKFLKPLAPGQTTQDPIENNPFPPGQFKVGDTNRNFQEVNGSFQSVDFTIETNSVTTTLELKLTDSNIINISGLTLEKKKITTISLTISEPTVSPLSVDTATKEITGTIRVFGRGVNEVNLKDDLKISVKNGNTSIALQPGDIEIDNTSKSYKIKKLDQIPFDKIEYILPNFQRVIVDASAILNIDVAFLSYTISNIVKGKVTDIFNEPLKDVKVAVGDIQRITVNNDEVISIINKEIEATPTNASGEYLIYIPNKVHANFNRNKNVVFNRDGYDSTNIVYSIHSIFSIIDIKLYNILNVFVLIEGDSMRSAFNVNISTLSLNRDVRTQSFSRYLPTLKRGFLKLTLDKGDFLHDEYQNVLIKSTISLADPNIADLPLPNPPYTPSTNGIRLSYTSEQQVYPIIDTEKGGDKIDEYFYLLPFQGYKEIRLNSTTQQDGTDLIYSYPPYDIKADGTLVDCIKTCLANGNLYIGLDGLKPGSNLSLLIQILEGSELNPDVTAPNVCWSYLAKDNDWKPLPTAGILKDTTFDLKRTGIVQIATPRDMVKETTLFRGECFWLRAAVSEKVENGVLQSAALGLPSIVNIQAQAIAVQFLNNENELSHLAQPLPASSIKQLRISRSAVKRIDQPFVSSNGRLPEEGNTFYVRVSERLRHRDRAVTIYDYEHLILERFPQIRRAKCLNHTKPGNVNILTDTVEADVELAPGYVTVAVIPSVGTRTGEAAAEPRFSQGDLEEMAEYLRTKTNLFVAGDHPLEDPPTPYLRVVNPLYEEVKLIFKVKFKRGEDGEARRFDLDRAIKGFLAPWLFDENFDIVFGRTLHRSKIILFIEQQSYVDGIADLVIFHNNMLVEGAEIIPTTSRSILTTVIDEDEDPDTTDHKIEVSDFCPDSRSEPSTLAKC